MPNSNSAVSSSKITQCNWKRISGKNLMMPAHLWYLSQKLFYHYRQTTGWSSVPWKQTRVLWCRANSFEPGFSNADGLTRRPSTWSPVSRALQYSFISLPQTLQHGTYCITIPAIRCPFWLQQLVSGHWNTALRLNRQKQQISNTQCTSVFQNLSLQ
jgi:hypothetical protein